MDRERKIEAIVQDLCAELEEDWVQLWVVPLEIRRVFGELPRGEMLSIGRAVLTLFVGRGAIVGRFRADGQKGLLPPEFYPPLPPNSAPWLPIPGATVDDVMAAWERSGTDPRMDGNVWFARADADRFNR